MADDRAVAGQVFRQLEPGQVVELEPAVTTVDPERCSGCSVCLAACDFGVVNVAQEQVAKVDEEQIVVDFVSQALGRIGYQVIALTSSEDAWALFEREPDAFDVVITDQTMPRLTGAAVAECMPVLRPQLPVILCTGFSHLVTPKIVTAKDIRRYLGKPFSVTELHAALREVVEGVGP